MRKKISLSVMGLLCFMLVGFMLVVSCATGKKSLFIAKRQIAYCTIDVENAYKDGVITGNQYRQAKGFLLQAASEWNNAKKLYDATGEEQSLYGIAGFLDATIAILPAEFQKYKLETK